MTTETRATTLAEAESAIAEWQEKLDTARATLAETESNIGQVALADGVDAATERALRCQIEVRMCETALAAAHVQRDEVRRHERAERAKQLRAEAAALDRQAEEHAAFYNEWAPKVEAARDQMTRLAQRALLVQRQAEAMEARLYEGAMA